MGMRRVSFLQEDMETSSKAIRLKELCDLAMEEGRKVIVYSFFRDTIRKVIRLLGGTADGTVAGGTAAGSAAGGMVVGSITGSTPVEERQDLIDRFTETPGGAVLVSQVQAGGTGLNIQAAGIVIFCEPQIKPSLEWQALSRVYRMGQVQNVLVYHLLCENTVDEAVRSILARKEEEFDLFAQESVIADAADGLTEKEWIRKLVEDERRKYLPAVVAAEPVANSAAEPVEGAEEIAAGEPVDEPEEGASD
jgi:SNF2 family DNA or RNA helicase